MTPEDPMKKVAVWAVTQNGASLGRCLADQLPGVHLFLSKKLEGTAHVAFDRLAGAVTKHFNRYDGHIFIMSTGIVVRMIAPHLRKKTSDPAVVVTDEKGRYAISLISGHLGGANRLARTVAHITHGRPVITTATDVNNLPAIDMLAQKHGLGIENPNAIKHVNMAILNGAPIDLYDPYGFLGNLKDNDCRVDWRPRPDVQPLGSDVAGVFIDDRQASLPRDTLVLRPPTLAAGIGCNRGAGVDEIQGLLDVALAHNGLARGSLKTIASVDIKEDEIGLQALAKRLKLPLQFYTRDQLSSVDTIQTPSAMVEKHIGVKNVCEAAAILATERGHLIVPKTTTKNVTVAIARVNFTS